MSNESDQNPLRRKVMTRQPGLVGAQWWNEGLTAMSDPVTRRKALQALAVLGGSVAVTGLLISSSSDDEDYYYETYEALKMQRERGWNFGATDDTLTFSGEAKVPLQHARLDALATELAPRQDALKPFYQATLFQSVSGDQGGAVTNSAQSLRNALRPIYTPAMDTAFHQGLGLAHLFAKQEEVALATVVLVDLPGPESVAFAAALAGRFEPLFTYDNWPHPVGVVPAHLTLAAVAYYQPVFRQLARQRKLPAPPMFVLDNQRLAPYKDERTQFDNRYVARMPSAEQLRKLGIQHVLYVTPGVTPGGKNAPRELDDLNEDFLAWRAAGLDVKLVAASDFRPAPQGTVTPVPATAQASATDGGTTAADGGTPGPAVASTPSGPPQPTYYFGGSPAMHERFWTMYPWVRGSTSPEKVHGLATAGILSAAALATLSGGYAYEPSRRTTFFSGMPRAASGAPRILPNRFGKVSMRVSSKTRAILGPAFYSRSSWNRMASSSSYSGG